MSQWHNNEGNIDPDGPLGFKYDELESDRQIEVEFRDPEATYDPFGYFREYDWDMGPVYDRRGDIMRWRYVD